jgi:hypothetical protein
MTNKLLKEIRETNSAARDLRAANTQLQQLLLLDEMLLKAESEVGLMDGFAQEEWQYE